jgi:adenine phosphoribosyltransferase
VPDFPRPGIVFKDLTPVLADPLLFHGVVSALAARVATLEITEVVGIEARGFILGGALAATLRRGFVPGPQAGKLPRKAHREPYGLEYGDDALELHVDALVRNARVLVVDDLIATGGTALATEKLIRRAGGIVVGFSFLVELTYLGGADGWARTGWSRCSSTSAPERPSERHRPAGRCRRGGARHLAKALPRGGVRPLANAAPRERTSNGATTRSPMTRSLTLCPNHPEPLDD